MHSWLFIDLSEHHYTALTSKFNNFFNRSSTMLNNVFNVVSTRSIMNVTIDRNHNLIAQQDGVFQQKIPKLYKRPARNTHGERKCFAKRTNQNSMLSEIFQGRWQATSEQFPLDHSFVSECDQSWILGGMIKSHKAERPPTVVPAHI